MNPADLPRDAVATTAEGLLDAVRAVARGPLAEVAEAIDRQGHYPRSVMQQLGALGAMSAHLDGPAGRSDYGLAIRAMAEVSRVCGATGFMVWCQAVCGLYMQASGNPALAGDALMAHATGRTLGGTAMSNPMKSYAQIESLLLKAVPVDGGYRVSGTLPWVSNLGPDHACGALAGVVDEHGEVVREVMFLLRCDAPGVEMRECPSFSAMEGTGTYALRLKDHFIGTADTMADPTRPFIARIRAAFVMLQCGMAVGITQGAIDSMWAVEAQLGHVNQFLEDRPDALQAELEQAYARWKGQALPSEVQWEWAARAGLAEGVLLEAELVQVDDGRQRRVVAAGPDHRRWSSPRGGQPARPPPSRAGGRRHLVDGRGRGRRLHLDPL